MNQEESSTIATQGRGDDQACAELDIDSLHVVELRFDGELLTLDGSPVDYGWQPPHELAVRAVALGIARPRGEAVRAFAEDETGTASELLILPDGSSTVIRTCEESAAGDRVPSDAEAALARFAVKRANPWLVGPLEESATQAGGTGPARAVRPVRRPVRWPALRAPRWPALPSLRLPALPSIRLRRDPLARVVAAIALSATIVAAVAVALVVTRGDEGTAPVSSAPTTPRTVEVEIAPRTVLSNVPRTLAVTAVGGESSLELTITASRLPVSAVIVVDPAGPAEPFRQTVVLRKPATPVLMRGIVEGPATWEVEVEDAPLARGRTQVKADPAFDPVEEPVPSQAPAPPPPSPRPPPGPTAPYDPDDH